MELLFGMPGAGEWIIFSLGFLIIFILPIIALIDILRHNFKGQNDKVIWVLVVLIMNFLGSILYFVIGRQQRVL
jgi:hypothetical protein